MEVYDTLFREEELRAELRVSILGRFHPFLLTSARRIARGASADFGVTLPAVRASVANTLRVILFALLLIRN